jgi:hypothetical protein
MMKPAVCCVLLLGLSPVALDGPVTIVTTAVSPATFEQAYICLSFVPRVDHPDAATSCVTAASVHT